MAAPLLKSGAEILVCPKVLTQLSSCHRRDTRSQRSSTGGHQPSPFASRASWDAWPSILASSRPGGDSLIRPAAVQEAVSHRAARQPKLLLPDRACTLFFLHSACCLRDTRNQPVSLLFAHFAAFFFFLKHKWETAGALQQHWKLHPLAAVSCTVLKFGGSLHAPLGLLALNQVPSYAPARNAEEPPRKPRLKKSKAKIRRPQPRFVKLR